MISCNRKKESKKERSSVWHNNDRWVRKNNPQNTESCKLCTAWVRMREDNKSLLLVLLLLLMPSHVVNGCRVCTSSESGRFGMTPKVKWNCSSYILIVGLIFLYRCIRLLFFPLKGRIISKSNNLIIVCQATSSQSNFGEGKTNKMECVLAENQLALVCDG